MLKLKTKKWKSELLGQKEKFMSSWVTSTTIRLKGTLFRGPKTHTSPFWMSILNSVSRIESDGELRLNESTVYKSVKSKPRETFSPKYVWEQPCRHQFRETQLCSQGWKITGENGEWAEPLLSPSSLRGGIFPQCVGRFYGDKVNAPTWARSKEPSNEVGAFITVERRWEKLTGLEIVF